MVGQLFILSGVLIEQFYHKTHMLFAMVTGYKKAEGKDAKVSMVTASFCLFSDCFVYGNALWRRNIITIPFLTQMSL